MGLSPKHNSKQITVSPGRGAESSVKKKPRKPAEGSCAGSRQVCKHPPDSMHWHSSVWAGQCQGGVLPRGASAGHKSSPDFRAVSVRFFNRSFKWEGDNTEALKLRKGPQGTGARPQQVQNRDTNARPYLTKGSSSPKSTHSYWLPGLGWVPSKTKSWNGSLTFLLCFFPPPSAAATPSPWN